MAMPPHWKVLTLSDSRRSGMLRSAEREFPGTPLSKAGRELTQHPYQVGLGQKDATSVGRLRAKYRDDAGINRAARDRVADILKRGTAVQHTDVVDVLLARPEQINPQTPGARWKAGSLEFVGFLGRP
jgi:hypothetical protein